ncbi:MAG TPA: methyltransferase domain-containing protein [Stellaceae bacterium]|nr:methyltransferase domain-containing protein [Stellaceae bacterium]
MMLMRFPAARIVAVCALLLAAAPVLAEESGTKLASLVAGPQRTEQNRVRDPYRHPRETLEFFGLRDDMTVVEIWPGGSGWWTEILAPYLAERGRFYAALPNPDASDEARKGNEAFAAKMAAAPALYGKVKVTTLDGDHDKIAPDGSADMVLTFRNLHDWVPRGTAEGALKAFYRALKPGGVLGVEDHRASPNEPQDPTVKSGYLREDFTIALVESVGFKLVARSEVNANPKDTKDYAAGVWTLPPTLRLKDQDRDRYVAIGESDRYTLKFVKP